MALKQAKAQIIYKILKNQAGSFVILFSFGSMYGHFLPFPRIAEHGNEIVWIRMIIKHPSTTLYCIC